MEFAEMAWRNGYTYLPEHPREQDCCDIYALYQIKDVIKTDYFCCAYEPVSYTHLDVYKRQHIVNNG